MVKKSVLMVKCFFGDKGSKGGLGKQYYFRGGYCCVEVVENEVDGWLAAMVRRYAGCCLWLVVGA